MRTRVLLLAAAALLTPAAGLAQSDPDLDRIPQASAPPESAQSTGGAIYAQADVTLTAPRDRLVVPLPPPAPPQWEARLFLDTRFDWRITDDLGFFYSGRFNLRAEDGLGFPGRENVRNDLREAYFAWQSGGGFFLQAGRINLKSGVALGFNPTDFFKTRAVVEPVSSDPTVLREDRLGTVMLLAQSVWSGGSLSIALAPKLSGDSAPYTNANLPSFDPVLDRTNAHNRALAKASVDLFADVSPEILLYSEAGHTRFGLNVTKGIGSAVVAYLEWSGGNRASLVDEAFVDGRDTVGLPFFAIPATGRHFFANDLALGASYATKLGINFDFEYDYHQAAFSGRDWRNWFDAGTDPALAGPLWFVRGYAADRQEPMARNGLFLRADWQNAFIRDLSLSSFMDVDLRDGSGLAQAAADYYVSPQWTVGALIDLNFGGRRTDFGSLPHTVSMLVKVSRYF